VTFFISEESITGTKIDYITTNCSETLYLVWGPIISTAILLTAIPVISYYAYWLSLEYKKWNIDRKNKVEGATLLTLDESLELRKNLKEEQDRLGTLITAKEADNKNLKDKIELYSKSSKTLAKEIDELKADRLERNKKVLENKSEESEKQKQKNLKIELAKLSKIINASGPNRMAYKEYLKNADTETLIEGLKIGDVFVSYFTRNGYIESVDDGFFTITPKGKQMFEQFDKLTIKE
jgi:hypothetical protein